MSLSDFRDFFIDIISILFDSIVILYFSIKGINVLFDFFTDWLKGKIK